MVVLGFVELSIPARSSSRWRNRRHAPRSAARCKPARRAPVRGWLERWSIDTAYPVRALTIQLRRIVRDGEEDLQQPSVADLARVEDHLHRFGVPGRSLRDDLVVGGVLPPTGIAGHSARHARAGRRPGRPRSSRPRRPRPPIWTGRPARPRTAADDAGLFTLGRRHRDRRQRDAARRTRTPVTASPRERGDGSIVPGIGITVPRSGPFASTASTRPMPASSGATQGDPRNQPIERATGRPLKPP